MYEVIFTRRARKGMSRLPLRDYERARQDTEGLSEEPRPQGARKMRGTGNLEEWRIRVGRDYRVVYRVDDEAREVVILAAGHRQGIYG